MDDATHQLGLRTAALVVIVGLGAGLTSACASSTSIAARDARPAHSAPLPPTAFADAVRAHDIDAIAATLAPTVALESPVLVAPFVGRPRVTRLFRVLGGIFRRIKIVESATGRGRYVLHFRTTVAGTPLEIVDLLRFDTRGRIDRITVAARPLPGIEALAQAVSPHLAEIG